MATPAEDRLAGIVAEIKVIRDRVDELQIKSAEQRVVWYKQPALLISILALLVSTVTTIGAFVAQARAKNLSDLQQLTTDIVDINKQVLDIDFTKDPSKATNLSSLLNNKRQIMISQAKELISKMGSRVPPEILYTIGYQEQTDGRAESAEKMYLGVLGQSSNDDVLQLATRRSLAILYMTPSTNLTDLAKGRQQFAAAIGFLAKKRDDNSIFQRAFTYETWGGMEFLNNQLQEGKEAYDNAEKWFKTLSPVNPLRPSSLSALPQYKAANFRATSAAMRIASKLQGTWKGTDKIRQLELTVINSDTGALTCSMSSTPIALDPSQPPAKDSPLNGVISLEDDAQAEVTFSVPNFLDPSHPTTYTFKLRLSDPGETIQMQEVVGSKWEWVTLTKS